MKYFQIEYMCPEVKKKKDTENKIVFTLHIELTSLANSKLLNNDSRMFALCILKPRRVNTQMKIV